MNLHKITYIHSHTHQKSREREGEREGDYNLWDEDWVAAKNNNFVQIATTLVKSIYGIRNIKLNKFSPRGWKTLIFFQKLLFS